jgi:exosortase/archaeosortase family protein
MHKRKQIAGVDYWPDNTELVYQHEAKPSLLRQTILFFFVFALFQVGWLLLRDNAFGHFVRGEITVEPAVAMINLFSPSIHAQALGNQIIAPGGGLVIKLGCEGLEAMFILIAAIIASSVKFKNMMSGLLMGTLLVYVLNQARILILFYTNRADKALFHLLHATIAPIVLIAIVGIFYYWWLNKNQITINPLTI